MIHFNGKSWKEPLFSKGEEEKFVYSLDNGDFNELGFTAFIQENLKKKQPVIGFFSYDFGLSRLGISSMKENKSNIPDVWFSVVNSKQLTVNSIVEQPDLDFQSVITKKEYKEAFEQIQKALENGEMYQANLTHLLQSEFKGNSWELFQSFYQKNPAEFSAYIDGGDWQMMSLSPERFVRIEPNGEIWTTPIKGTQPRGNDEKSDEEFKQNLLNSEKEKAELAMITDLLRNDLGKVCETGSVRVEKFREVMKLPNVWHTFSRIEGQLVNSEQLIVNSQVEPQEISKNSIQAILSMLPGGSITGCPKIRACEIIDRVEASRRGIYTGTMVAFWPDSSVDSSILIRTVSRERDQLTLGVGGGIVIDSELDSEWDESWAKAKSFMG